MSVLFQTQNLNKAFFGISAVNDVSIEVKAGEIFGLIGQNGAGKSTLMNLIGGVVQPDSGQMLFRGAVHAPRNPSAANNAGIAFIHQELNLFTNLSIAENIFIDNFPTRGWNIFKFINRQELNQRARTILEQVGLELDPKTIVEQISPGERQLVEIAKALYLDAELIIFDEPTTSLTARETQRLFEIMKRLRDEGKAIIFISHILKDVMALADTVAVMRDGVLMAQEPAANFDIDRMIRLMVGRKLEQLYPPKTATVSLEPLLIVKDISAKGIVKDINFMLHRGEVLGLFGLMGSGRTELARIIFGLEEYDKGNIVVADKQLGVHSARESIAHGVAFVTENRREEGLLMNINIADNIALVRLPQFSNTPLQIVDNNRLANAAQKSSSALQLKSGDISTQPAKALSGGNQQKVVIAKWLLSEPRIFVMDEPTRGVDVGAKHEIYMIIDQLAAAGSGVLVISSELEELIGICDRILVMNRGEIVGEFSRENFSEDQILRAAFREFEEGLHETPL